MDDTPDATSAIFLENSSDLVGTRQVAFDGVDLCALFIRVRRVLRQCSVCELRDTPQRGRMRIMVVVNRDHLVSSRLLQGKDDMGA